MAVYIIPGMHTVVFGPLTCTMPTTVCYSKKIQDDEQAI